MKDQDHFRIGNPAQGLEKSRNTEP